MRAPCLSQGVSNRDGQDAQGKLNPIHLRRSDEHGKEGEEEHGCRSFITAGELLVSEQCGHLVLVIAVKFANRLRESITEPKGHEWDKDKQRLVVIEQPLNQGEIYDSRRCLLQSNPKIGVGSILGTVHRSKGDLQRADVPTHWLGVLHRCEEGQTQRIPHNREIHGPSQTLLWSSFF